MPYLLAAATTTSSRTIGIAPAGEGDRECLIAPNVASVHGAMGRRVLLIDGSPGSSMLDRMLDLDPRLSLANLGLPHLAPEHIIQRCTIPGLDIEELKTSPRGARPMAPDPLRPQKSFHQPGSERPSMEPGLAPAQ